MGVPVLFHWFYSRIDKNILHKQYPYKGSPDVLYLDFNGGIHPAVKNDPALGLSNMNDAIVIYLDSICDYVKPKQTIYIAIDGVAPKAKMNQQQSRRYKAVIDRKLIHEIEMDNNIPTSINHIDFNMISPGTEFMHGVKEAIIDHVKQKKLGDWKELSIIFTDAGIPGEGEHKIMDHIRANPGTRNAIYGLDSDLMLLNLINYFPETVLVRESHEFNKKKRGTSEPTFKSGSPEYTYLTIDDLRIFIVTIMSPLVSLGELESFQIFNDLEFVEQYPEDKKYLFYRGTGEHKQRLIKDFVFICSMLGNDFLPHLTSISLRERGIESLLISYKIAMWDIGGFLVSENNQIDMKFFEYILRELSEVEDYSLRRQAEDKIIRISKFNKRIKYLTKYERELEELKYVENKTQDTVRMGEKGWKIRYYQEHFKIKYKHPTEFTKNVNKIIYKYCEGMKWVLLYYQGLNKNWDWSYGYLVSPSIQDMYYAVLDKNININNIHFNATEPVEPFVQLMSILPPESAHLLPPPLAILMTDRQSIIHYNYPIKVKISTANHKFNWECHPKLPPVNTQELTTIVKSKMKYISAKDKIRNDLGTVQVFI